MRYTDSVSLVTSGYITFKKVQVSVHVDIQFSPMLTVHFKEHILLVTKSATNALCLTLWLYLCLFRRCSGDYHTAALEKNPTDNQPIFIF